MGMYYNDKPPEQPSRWGRLIPRWLKRFWVDTEEILVISQVAFSLIFPILGVLFGFVFLCFIMFFIANQCKSAQ